VAKRLSNWHHEDDHRNLQEVTEVKRGKKGRKNFMLVSAPVEQALLSAFYRFSCYNYNQLLLMTPF